MSELNTPHCLAGLGDSLRQAPRMKDVTTMLQLKARLRGQLGGVAHAAEFITRGGGPVRCGITILVQTHNVGILVTQADTRMSTLVLMTTRLGPSGLTRGIRAHPARAPTHTKTCVNDLT
jgi:hypothetical protein